MVLEQQRLISDLNARQRIQADLISSLRGNKAQLPVKAITKAMEQVEFLCSILALRLNPIMMFHNRSIVSIRLQPTL